MAELYQPFRQVRPVFVNSLSFLQAFDFLPTILLILFLCFYAAILMVIPDGQSGMFLLQRSMKKGRRALISARIGVLVCSALLFCLLFFAANTIMATAKYGAIDFSAPVQSLYQFEGSILPLSIGQYILFFILVFWLICCLFSMMALAAGLFMGSVSGMLWVFLAVLLVEGVLKAVVDPRQTFQLLYFINLVQMIDLHSYFSTAFHLNLFGQPILLLPVFLILLVVLILVLALVNIQTFAAHGWSFRKQRRKQKEEGKKKIPVSSLIFQESWQLLILQKGWLVLLALVLLQGWILSQRQVTFLDDAYWYRVYALGNVDKTEQEVQAFIENQEKEFEDNQKLLMEAQSRLDAGEISSGEYTAISQQVLQTFKRQPGFDRYKEQAQYAFENDLPLVYDSGYLWMLSAGGEYPAVDLQVAFIAAMALLLLLAEYFCSGWSSGMEKLILTLPKARKERKMVRLGLCALMVLLVFVICYGSEFFWCMQTWPMQGLAMPLKAIMPLNHHFLANMPVWLVFLMVGLIRLAMLGFCAWLIAFLSHKTKNIIQVMGIYFFIILLPMILHLMGVTFLDSFSLNPLFSANMLFF